MSTAEMLNDLSDLMQLWLEGHHSRNLSILEQKCGTPYSTLKRILQRERKPTLETVLNILNTIASHKEFVEYLKQHVPILGEKIPFTADHHQHIDIPKLLKEKDNFYIITLASCRETSREEISKFVGESSNNAIDKLLDLGVIREINGRIIASDNCKDLLVMCPDTLLAENKILSEIFDKSKIGKIGSMIGIKTDSVSYEAIKKIYAILREAYNQIREIAEDSPGPYVFAASILMQLIGENKDEVKES